MESNRVGADVILLPGIPDTGIEQLADGRWAFPGTAPDVAKLLREQGLSVQWAHPRPDRTTVEHKAADAWLPVLLFTRDALASGIGDIFSAMVLSLLGRARAEASTLHVEFRVKTDEGVRTFKATGPGRDVLKALKEFDANG